MSLSVGAGLALAASANALPLTPALVNRLAEELRTNHPALLAASARVDAAAAEAGAVRAWRDPMVRLGGMFGDTAMRADEGDLVYGLQQPLPLFGRPRLQREVAQAGVERERAELEARFQGLRRDLAQALFRTAYAGRVVEIAIEDLRGLDDMVRTAEQRYGSGEGSLTDLLRLQNEQLEQRAALQAERERLAHAEFVVNRMLGRDPSASWPALGLPDVAEPVVYGPALVELALRHEPQILVLRQQAREAAQRSALTRNERRPEVSLGFEARHYSGNGEFRQAELMVEFSLPWGNRHRYDRDLDRDRARQRVVDHEIENARRELLEEIHGLTIEIEAARREARLYRDEILPRSLRGFASAQSAWSTGRGLFLEVLEARRMTLDARRKAARSVAEQYALLAQLVLCCGVGDLEALDMLQNRPADQTPTPE